MAVPGAGGERLSRRLLGAAIAGLIALGPLGPAGAQAPGKPPGALRIATFNAHLARGAPGALIDELSAGDAPQVDAVVEIVQRVRPDVLLINELDYDRDLRALALFEAELAIGRNGAAPIAYPHRFVAPVNAGVRSGFDLDRDGETNGPGDAWGWGVFPGQFGMALLSTAPIDQSGARTFRSLPWTAAPITALPTEPDGAPYYPAEVAALLRLSSKSHWDVPIATPDGGRLHLLASHPTPPVFDGPEDRNGLRNAAEILFWRAYLDDAGWIVDDSGRRGGLDAGAAFVILGDLNADPTDGDGRRDAIRSLLDDPRIQDPRPASDGGRAAAVRQCGANGDHRGDPARDTADWKDAGDGAPGNLRVDYVLPAASLTVVGAGVFWPPPDAPLGRLVGDGFPEISSDHRLVWVDVAFGPAAATAERWTSPPAEPAQARCD